MSNPIEFKRAPGTPRIADAGAIQQSMVGTRIETAQRFFRSFNNPVAREFFLRTHSEQTAFAIMSHHPQATALDIRVLKQKSQVLFNTIIERLIAISHQPELLFETIKSLGREAVPQNPIWFPEYAAAHGRYKHVNKPAIRAQSLAPHIVGNSVVDIGGGGGGQIVAIKEAMPETVRQAACIDILDCRPPAMKTRFRELGIEFSQLDFNQPGTVSPRQYTSGIILSVLHHVGETDREIGKYLVGVKTAVSQRLIVEEDAIITADDLMGGLVDDRNISKLRKAQPLLDEYLKFDPQTQKDILYITCLITNSLTHGVPEMPFPGGFKNISVWVKIFKESGFDVKNIEIPGFEPNYFVQRCPVVFVLERAA